MFNSAAGQSVEAHLMLQGKREDTDTLFFLQGICLILHFADNSAAPLSKKKAIKNIAVAKIYPILSNLWIKSKDF